MAETQGVNSDRSASDIQPWITYQVATDTWCLGERHSFPGHLDGVAVEKSGGGSVSVSIVVAAVCACGCMCGEAAGGKGGRG